MTFDDFRSRMSKHEAQMKALSGEEKVPTGYCVSCSKNFSTVKALENHNKSKKHLVKNIAPSHFKAHDTFFYLLPLRDTKMKPSR